MQLKPIGMIHSPYKIKGEAPRQGYLSQEEMLLEIYPSYVEGLKDLSNCSHILLLYWLDKANREILQTTTPFGPEIKGVFATRSPNRPNPIGVCVARKIKIVANQVTVVGLDAFHGTPLIDIKPYVPAIDQATYKATPTQNAGDKE